MKKLTFELEFITPAFIGRVDPKNAGLRSASFTGLLRWWYRKILQAKINSTDSIYEE
ncbi:type III-B CRISPR module RAMP protein Cmr1 [Hydrogenobacter thermophilus]|uniref:type III-B CRISPR module RAMP protein Cmr1 n=1 Tax=Hydrogenobacter thermophilus TaxID=940 RepID=UPI0030F7F836